MLERLFALLSGYIPALAILAAVLLILWLINRLLVERKRKTGTESRVPRAIVLLVLAGLGTVTVIFALPISADTRNQLLGLLGLLLSAIIALSSTTFVSNMLAGMMLRAEGGFKPADFVRVGDQFGRVTQRGLFHVEIQTENRNLATIPNLYMISHPITVVRASGTIVHASVSLGYDNSHVLIETLLVKAAKDAQLQDPFVQVMQLGDYAVTYRIAGFLPEVKQLLTARSNLRKMMIDSLHAEGIEIVSPAFMNQRRLSEKIPVIPTQTRTGTAPVASVDDHIPEELIFDKAEEVEKIEQLRSESESLAAEIQELENQLKTADTPGRTQLENVIRQRRQRSQSIAGLLVAAEKEPKT